jgi:hypothetical protein
MKNTRLARNRVVVLLTTLSFAVGLTALSTTAMAGNGDGKHHHHHHKKKCPKGYHKEVVKKHGKVVKKKNGKPKKKCVKNHNGNSGSSAAKLTITPTSQDFGSVEHGTTDFTEHSFTVKNSGGTASGTPAASITEVHNPQVGGPPAFSITANTCTAAIPPAGSCSLTLRFGNTSNAGDEMYSSVLHVVASPGGNAQAQLTGIGN